MPSSEPHHKPLTNLNLVEACDNLPYEPSAASEYYTLHLPNDPNPHGYLTAANISLLPWHASDAFKISHANRTVSLTPDTSNGKDTSTACSEAFAAVVNAAIDADTFHILSGQHSEFFRIVGARIPVKVERFATPLFGITTRGVHLTIFYYLDTSPDQGDGKRGKGVRRSFKDMRIWVPRRSLSLFTSPGKLDSSVAGGVPAHESPLETLVHEADEEASLPRELIEGRVRSGGTLTIMFVAEPVVPSNASAASGSTSTSGGQQGMSTGSPGKEGYVCGDCMYVYDLELSAEEAATIKMVPKDGEVKEFLIMSIDEIKKALANGEFKPNSALVMLDFFIRHGVITPEDEPDYVEIVSRLHRRLPFPLKDLGCSYEAP